jgi:hypothetical protein
VFRKYIEAPANNDWSFAITLSANRLLQNASIGVM